MKYALDHLTVTPATPIRAVMECISRNARGIALVVDGEGRLQATITDGDIRTAILGGTSLARPIAEVAELQRDRGGPHPITASLGATREEVLALMRNHRIRHVPLVDDGGRVGGILELGDLVDEEDAPRVKAVVMAGGEGRRLRPLTQDLPKPMLPVGDKPLMERIVDQLKRSGIRHVSVTTHYKSEAIVDHFGDGRRFGIDIRYVHERQPLGTAGSLRLLTDVQEPLLVVNGDILTGVSFRALFDYHRYHQADMTIGVREFEIEVPYGVVQTDENLVVGLDEKPKQVVFVNAGVYLLEPSMRDYIPPDERFDMTQLIARLIAVGRKVVSFPIHEFWLDIGRPADYESAKNEVSV